MSRIKGDALLLQDAKSHTKSDAGTTAKFGDWLANAIYLGTAGDVTFVKDDDTTVQLPAMLAGMWHSVMPFKRVNSTGTTPSAIVVGITFQG